MMRPQALPTALAFAALLALGACRPSSESRAPASTTPTVPQSSASAGTTGAALTAASGAASGTVSGEQTAPRTDSTGSASPTGTPK